MEQQLTLGYWGIKGYAEPVRWLLHYLQVPYTEKNPDMAKFRQWPEQKQELQDSGSVFLNLPYIIDGDFSMTESSAIPVYLANKHNRGDLLGKDWRETARMLEIQGVLTDAKKALMTPFFAPDYAEKFAEQSKEGSKAMEKFGYLNDAVGDQDFFLGHLTIVDFVMAYTLTSLDEVLEGCKLENPMTQFKNLIRLKENVLGLDGVREYLASDDYGSRPYVPAMFLPWNRK